MKEYIPTKKETLKLRKEQVRLAKDYIKSLTVGMGKYAKGSNVEGAYMSEKLESLQKKIKRMVEKGY